ncbi:hypothetical protein ACGFNU_24375 [Spirillospora sp. NPDC048911]|uniref:hypothetical protein n=1 Tax=Spirillospora sp. NPDC048911 TaxID=3364527 RepID=UPI003718AFBB
MPYPTFTAGQRLTAALLAAMQPLEAIKTSDQVVTNSVVLVDDTQLALPLVGGASYRGRLVLYYSAEDTGDLDYAWAVPAGTIGRRGLIGPDPTSGVGVSLIAAQSRVSGSFATEFTLGGADAVHRVAIENILITPGVSGNLQLRFAQGTAAAGTNATVLANSNLTLWRTA